VDIDFTLGVDHPDVNIWKGLGLLNIVLTLLVWWIEQAIPCYYRQVTAGCAVAGI